MTRHTRHGHMQGQTYGGAPLRLIPQCDTILPWHRPSNTPGAMARTLPYFPSSPAANRRATKCRVEERGHTATHRNCKVHVGYSSWRQLVVAISHEQNCRRPDEFVLNGNIQRTFHRHVVSHRRALHKRSVLKSGKGLRASNQCRAHATQTYIYHLLRPGTSTCNTFLSTDTRN